MPNYTLSMRQVAKPIDVHNQYSETKVISVEQSAFEDEYIKIRWTFDFKFINVVIRNKSDHTIEIPWDRAVYINQNGICSRLVNSEIKYSETNNIHIPSYIPKGATKVEYLTLANGIYYDEGWQVNNILPAFSSDHEIRQSRIIGKNLTVVLPVVIEGVLNEYTFTFNITDVTIK